jgi:large subunit ribosomal protein L29
MKASDLREKDAPALRDELLALCRERFNLRMQQATGQLPRADQLNKVRKNIARVKTVMREQQASVGERRL